MKSFVTAVVLLMAATPAFCGVVYKATTRSQTGEAIAVTLVRGYIQGADARLEFLHGSSVSPGTYILTRDGGKTFVQVDPGQRMFSTWNSPETNPTQVMEAQPANASVSEPTFEKLVDEDGGVILGMPTRHVKYRTSYSFTLTLTHSHTTQIVSEDELWITQKISDPGIRRWFAADANEQADALIRTELSKINGVPLKRITVLTSIEEDGESETTRTEMNVTEFTERILPATTFTVPAGYKQRAAPGQSEETDQDR